MNRARCLALSLPTVLTAAALAQSPAPAGVPAAQPAASAQTTTQPALPTDAEALMELISQANGLRGPNLQPWHIRASWQTLDDQKKIADHGTLEEWWAGEKKVKVDWKSDTVDRTLYTTDSGTYLVKRTDATSWQFATVQRLLTTPINIAKAADGIKNGFRTAELNQGSVSLRCVFEDQTWANGNPLIARMPDGKTRPVEVRVCIAGDLPAVRSQLMFDGGQTVFNDIVRFQGQYLARRIRSVGASGVETDINVDLVEAIDAVLDADFTPPAGATAVPEGRKVTVSPSVMAGARIGGKDPVYPESARNQRIQGMVVLQAVIETDGTIGDLYVRSGPPVLQQAALDAVKTWKYRPYLLNGQPVEVETQIEVVFRIFP
jgi:TonB family protein